MKTIFFDLGGVILEDGAFVIWPKLKHLSALERSEAERIFRDFKRKDSLADLEKGLITPDRFFRSYYRLVDLKIEIRQFEKLFFESFRPLEEMHRIIRDLHGKAKLCLFSNHNKDWMERWIHRYPVFSHFEYLFVSGPLQLRKPDPSFYHYALRHSGSRPADTLMIDDQPENLHTARRLGLHTFLFHGEHAAPRLREYIKHFLEGHENAPRH